MKKQIFINKQVGKQRIVDNIVEMINNSENNVIMTMKYWGIKWGSQRIQDHFGFARFEKNVIDAIERGVSVRIIGSVNKETLNNVRKLRECGARLKHMEYGFPRFIIKDDANLLIAISEPYTESLHYYYSIITNNNILIDFFKDYFENIWRESIDVEEAIQKVIQDAN